MAKISESLSISCYLSIKFFSVLHTLYIVASEILEAEVEIIMK